MKDKIIFNIKILIRRIIYLFLFIINRNNKENIIILCYHGVSSDKWRFNVSFENIKKQVEYLQKNYTFITLDDLDDYINGKKELSKHSVVITFDDGYEDLLKTKKFFNNKNIKPALFVLSDRKDANRKELDNHKKFLSKEQLMELIKNGWIIGSHSATHSDFNNLTDLKINKEISDSKKDLERELGIKIKYFAYPKGRYSKKVLNVVEKSGFSLGLSMNDGVIDKKSIKFLIPRIGVDGSHSFMEFKSISTPLSIKFRKFIKERMTVSV